MLRAMGTAGSLNSSEMFSQCSAVGKNFQFAPVMSASVARLLRISR